MKAVQYRLSIPQLLLAKLLARRFPGIVNGPLAPTRLVDQPAPGVKGPEWAVVAPTLSGICGTDLGVLTASVSPSASPFSSFPAVLGHEVVGVITEAGSEVPHPPGTRVVIDPSINCRMRGFREPCPRCKEGFPYLCEKAAEGDLAPGLITGFNRDLPGGWGQLMAAHKDQIHRVPDEISDEKAVLVEPLAVGVHALLRGRPRRGDRILIIGAGTIGLSVTAAVKLMGLDVRTTLVARYPFQAELGRLLGADEIISGRGDTILEDTVRLTGARMHKPILGRPVLRGGFDIVYDCVGSRGSIDDAMRVTREQGTLVLVGGAGELGGLDWNFVWMRELSIVGTAGYGPEPAGEEQVHTIPLTLQALAENPHLPVEKMITHRFPLAEYRRAIGTAMGRRKEQAVKVVFEQESPPKASPGDRARPASPKKS